MARKKNDSVSSAPDTVVPERDATADTPWYQVSGWRLRNKIALALAFPMIAASWFATDKAIESYEMQQSHKASAGQLRVLDPALEYLYAAENAYVQSLQTPAGSTERREASEAVAQAADRLRKVADSDDLTRNQSAQIKNLLDWEGELTNTESTRVLTATNSQASQLHNAVSDFFQTIVDGQVVPEASLQQISFVMDGHIALTQQRIYTEYEGDVITNVSSLFQWIGIERGAIESIADVREAGDAEATNLRSQNVQRQDLVDKGRGELKFAAALDIYDSLNTAALEESLAALDQKAADARNKALANMIILALSLLTTLALAYLIVRLILGPVRTVRDGALAVANRQLPEAVARIRAGEEPGEVRPISVHTNEEMGQLARAVDDLHQTAVDLASDEAKLRTQVGEMFVTLSRRNTSLINQQLGLIEELERDEQEPRRLENLFRLDHLAARMRRTAESLVILSDAPVRQRETAPLAVTDALQAATAGVQEYQRVELRGASPAKVVGSAANDVVHLLTELIDNALSFSPPTAPVQVSTTEGGGEITIAISDGGLGMPADMLAQLNEMLSSQVGITPDAARRMGLFVVSRLAHRHNIGVNLAENGRGGVTASVTLPATLTIGAQTTPAAAAPAAPVVDTFLDGGAAPAAPAPAVTAEPPVTPEPVVAAEPVVPEPVIAPIPEKPADAPVARAVPDPLSDPLTDPFVPEPAAPESSQAEDGGAPSGLGGLGNLPKRRPGSTVPSRAAAVSPLGSSLFGGGDEAPSGGLFARTVDDEAPAAEAPVEEPALAVAPLEPVPAPADVAEETPAAEPETPEPVIAPVVEPVIAPVTEPEPVAVDEPATAQAEPELDALGLPRREAPVIDEPSTPSTPEGSVNLFAAGGPDTRTLPERDRDENPTAAARMGMFNALARSPRNLAREAASSTGSPSALDGPSVLDRQPDARPTDVQQKVADLGAEAVREHQDRTAAAPGSNGSAPGQHSSGWLSGSSDTSFQNSAADAGWAAAAEVAKHVETEKTGAGLPQRRPGQRLVPGAVATSKKLPPRDPDAIRRRLASHAAGVSRGRSASAPTNTPAQEEGKA